MPETSRTISASLAFAGCIDRLTAAIGRTVAWACLLVVMVQFTVVVMRYVFGLGSIWLTETIIYGHATLFMLASAWTLREGGHVRVDVFYADAGPRRRALVDLCGSLLLLLPFMLVLLSFAVPYVARSWAILETSRETSGLPAVYLLKTLIPAFALLMALQGISQAIRAANVLHTPPVTPGLDPGVHSSSQDGLPGQARQ
jgi:TRAP-type mannitol/chloroaromatic compound transport system permease small subunit